MIIEGKVEWKEYLKALYLHMRPRPWLKIVGIVLLSLFVLTYSYLMINIVRNKATFSSAFAMTVACIYLILWFFLYLPYKARKVYKQQKTLQALYKIEVVSDGLKCSSEIGNS
jgi:protein-S-isoprenylcysteine O-methyltransferase Ste14